MKMRLLIATILTSTAIFFSCSKDENTDPKFSAEDSATNAKVDMAANDISRTIEDALVAEDGISGKYSVSQSAIPTCATISRVPDYGTVITPGTTITKTIAFNPAGCTLPSGNVVRGTIVITFVYQPSATTHTINYHFDNFYHNDIKINGDKNFTRTLTSTPANSEVHPVYTMNMNLTATLPSGEIVTRVGSRVSEIIEGYGTTDLLDNVYRVTGEWTTTFPSGIVEVATITSPMIFKVNCHHFVKGIISFVRNGHTATLDYGDGTCDNIAILTYNGLTFTIVLGN